MLLAIEGGVARAGGWGKGIGIDAEKRSLVGGEALDEEGSRALEPWAARTGVAARVARRSKAAVREKRIG
jgi:hypothetical protein